MARHILPALFRKYIRKGTPVFDANEQDREAVYKVHSQKAIFIDNVGLEYMTDENGKPFHFIAEVMEEAERSGVLPILATNLNKEQLKQKYGDVTFDRMLSMTIRIPFIGESMRDKNSDF